MNQRVKYQTCVFPGCDNPVYDDPIIQMCDSCSKNRSSYNNMVPVLKSPKKQKISATKRWAVWERDNFTCRSCGSRKYLSVDHIIPESKGGDTNMDNLQTLCKRCNSKKGDKSVG